MSLRDWRYSAGLSQRQLALRARVSRATLAHLEQERRLPSVGVAGRVTQALSQALGLKLETWHVFPQVFQAPARLLEEQMREQA